MSARLLCALAEVPDPGSRGFELARGEGELPFSLFVVRKDGKLSAYRNSCPHTGAPLEWLPHQFLDRDNGFIECALHGALFDVHTGRCLRGPCVGDHLQALAVSVREGNIWLASTEPLVPDCPTR